MAKSATTLKKGDNLPKRGKAKKTLMLDAIKSVCGTEEKFFKKVVALGLGDSDTPANPTLLTLVLNRIEPPLKPVSPMVKFDLDTTLKPFEQCDQILRAAANEQINPDIAKMFIESIASMLRVQEITDIDERLKAIEQLSEQS